ncbi:CG31759 [Drosophila busckii]|uniref:2',5'-phosphodiesterase 12 n=2 Tax=Drosophila busckii TaxID=30019 RepID=A0A0M4E975_DROBS|nr:CG31759 [Drosophila busckii]
MDKVYFRNAENTNELHITFHYTNKELRVDRDFNFCRRLDENVDEAISRIRSNVEKEFNKRNKKKKNKQCSESPTAVVEIPTEIIVELQRNDSADRITDITFGELLVNKAQGLKLQVIDKTFEIVLNQPWIAALQLPNSMMAGYLVYPFKLDLLFASREHCRGEWYRAVMPPGGVFNERTIWEACGEGLIYQVQPSDIDHHLKLVVTPRNEHGESGPTAEYISKKAVQAGPGQCPFELRHAFTSAPLSDPNAIRVVSYNLLADYYADGEYARKTLFPYCASHAMDIDYRKQLFIKELLGYNADLLCLQEVDVKIFDYDLSPVLEQLPHHFRGIMTPKGSCAEGLALFYRASRFELLNNFDLHLGDNISSLPIFASLWNKIKHNEQLAKRICERSTTLQLSLLKLTNSERYVLVANTHLYFHPDADHIRLLQIGFSLIFVEHIYKQAIKEHNIENPHNIGLLFCGDFNSVPECGIYKLMTEQLVDSSFIDWSSNVEEAVKNVDLTQPFNMTSACGTPEFTNYTTLFAACLDYIFYQNDCFEVVQSVPLPTTEQLRAHEAIPSIVCPSDHVALVADLAFKNIR